jgi:hypothetical protein
VSHKTTTAARASGSIQGDSNYSTCIIVKIFYFSALSGPHEAAEGAKELGETFLTQYYIYIFIFLSRFVTKWRRSRREGNHLKTHK